MANGSTYYDTANGAKTALSEVINDADGEAWVCTELVNVQEKLGEKSKSIHFATLTVTCGRPAVINSVTCVSVPAGTYTSGQVVPVTVTLAEAAIPSTGTTLTVNGVQCPLLNTAGTESHDLTFGYTVRDVDTGAINVTALSDTLVNYYGDTVTLENNVDALDAASFGAAQDVRLASAGVKGSTLDLTSAKYGIDDAANAEQTVTVVIPFKSGVAKDWVANESAELTQPVALPIPGDANAEASYYLTSAYFSADGGKTRYPVYVIGENADALAARFVPTEANMLAYLRKDTVQLFIDPEVGTTRNYIGTWANKQTDAKGYAYFTASAGAAEAPALADASWSYYVKGSCDFDPTAYISRGEGTYTVDSGFIPVGGSYVVAQNTEHDLMSVTVDDQIALNIYLDLDYREKTVDDVTITLGGEPYPCEGKKMIGGAYNGLYKFKVYMAPAEIAKAIDVEIDDNVVHSTSVKEYCDKLRKEYNAYPEAQALAKAMLEYGQAANDVFANGTTVPAADIADISQLSPTAAQNAAAVFTDGTGKVSGASFMALTKPEFRFYTKSISEQTGYNYNQAGVTATMENGSDNLNARFVKKADKSVLIEVTGITAENMDKTVTVTVADLGTITFNGNAFAKAMAKSVDEKQSNLGAALYNYGAAAKECFKPREAVELETSIKDVSKLTGNYEAQDGETLTGALTGNRKITIASGATVTLKNLTIKSLSNSESSANYAGITLMGNATLLLEGTNEVRGDYGENPGIYVPENATLTIDSVDGTGKLNAYSQSSNWKEAAAGIGSPYNGKCGSIVIKGGIVTASGKNGGAGIGSGYKGTCGDITVNGGTVTATASTSSSASGAGIGSGHSASCGKIVINAGTVTANGVQSGNGAGIGSGTKGTCDSITINGGTVTANGVQSGNAAGIGSGMEGTCESITIIDGNVTAKIGTSGDGAAIGCAAGGNQKLSTCGDITISGGTVKGTAKTRDYFASGAGIGAGAGGYGTSQCGKITITSGVTKVTATKGSEAPTSIGNGNGNSTCGTVSIASGANVTQN